MNWLDFALMGLLAVGFIKGCSDGLIRQLAALIALAAAIYFCSKVAVILRQYVVQTGWFPEHGVTVASYVLAFILIVSIVVLVGSLVHKLISVTPLGLFNHLAGGFFALIVTALLLSLILSITEGLDRRSTIISMETKVESRFYPYVKEIVTKIYPADLFVWREQNETKED
ncbi:MAG: CvpA family protein [Tannerella sp.]|jgi:membrane protein required for colicin V production|nr:CvpA family protein [Tannerella sp.]